MKLPNNYGSVFKLSGKRRRPYAVRIKIGDKDNGSAIYKYLGYFAKSQDAYTFLAKYNEGLVTPDNRLKTTTNGSPNMKSTRPSVKNPMNLIFWPLIC